MRTSWKKKCNQISPTDQNFAYINVQNVGRFILHVLLLFINKSRIYYYKTDQYVALFAFIPAGVGGGGEGFN